MLKEQLTDLGKMFIPELIRYLYTMLLFRNCLVFLHFHCVVYILPVVQCRTGYLSKTKGKPAK